MQPLPTLRHFLLVLLVVLVLHAGLWGVTPPAAAQDDGPRPRIAVGVELAETAYRDHFGARAAEVEAGIRDVLLAHLGEEVGFLDFVAAGAPASGGEAGGTLHLRVGTAGAERFRPVSLHLSLEGEILASRPDPFLIEFRSVEESIDPFGSVEVFVLEAGDAIERIERPTWVEKLFYAVELTNTAHFYQRGDSWYWALPFSLDDIRADIQTVFAVRAHLELELGDRREHFHLAEAEGNVEAGHPSVPASFHDKAKAKVTNADRSESIRRCRAEYVTMNRYLTEKDLLEQLAESQSDAPSSADLGGRP